MTSCQDEEESEIRLLRFVEETGRRTASYPRYWRQQSSMRYATVQDNAILLRCRVFHIVTNVVLFARVGGGLHCWRLRYASKRLFATQRDVVVRYIARCKYGAKMLVVHLNAENMSRAIRVLSVMLNGVASHRNEARMAS